MKYTLAGLLSLLLLAGTAFRARAEEADLIRHMGAFQYYAHKTTLAIDHKNRELASFYVHEIEHTLKDVMGIEIFDNQPIGKLAEKILAPAFDHLEDAIRSQSWDVISSKLDDVIDACNQCHKTTQHGFIHIQRRSDNPYMQSFEPTVR